MKEVPMSLLSARRSLGACVSDTILICMLCAQSVVLIYLYFVGVVWSSKCIIILRMCLWFKLNQWWDFLLGNRVCRGMIRPGSRQEQSVSFQLWLAPLGMGWVMGWQWVHNWSEILTQYVPFVVAIKDKENSRAPEGFMNWHLVGRCHCSGVPRLSGSNSCKFYWQLWLLVWGSLCPSKLSPLRLLQENVELLSTPDP